MEKYNVSITPDTINVFVAIERQHNVKMECETIQSVEPALDCSPQTGAINTPVKVTGHYTVTVADENRRLK